MVKAKDLKLGDKVQLFDGPYGTATVYLVNNTGSVSVWRPYVMTSDFYYGDYKLGTRVIPSIGLEDLELYYSTEVLLVERLEKEPE